MSCWSVGAGGASAEHAAEVCPVCQEALGAELAMLPCGHQLCVRCQMALIERLPGNLPRVRSSAMQRWLYLGRCCCTHVGLHCKTSSRVSGNPGRALNGVTCLVQSRHSHDCVSC